MIHRREFILVGLVVALVTGSAVHASDLEQAMQQSSNWASQTGDYANHRYSDLKQINAGNVDQLQVAWTMSTGVLRGHEGSPLVIGDTMYMHTPFPNNVYRGQSEGPVLQVEVRAEAGRARRAGDVLRHRESRPRVRRRQDLPAAGGHDARRARCARPARSSGRAKNGDPKIGETNTNAPHVFKDKVITGISGGEFGVRGRLIAYDLKTGKKVWTAWSTGPDSELLVDPKKTMTWTNGKMAPIGADSSLKTWKGDQWKLGGGTTWGWYAYDPTLNLVYYGTGNPGTWNPAQRPGDNKWSMTIFARDLDTGMAKWAYQMTPHDEWDFDGVNENAARRLSIRRARRCPRSCTSIATASATR